MKKIYWLIAFSLVFLTACTSAPAANNQVAKQSVDWPLYKIQSDSKTVGYLLGTIHIGDSAWYPFPEEVTQAIDNASCILTEVKLTSLYSQNAFNGAANDDSYKQYLLKNYFSAAQLKELKEVAASYNIKKIDPEKMTLVDFYLQLQSTYIDQADALNGVEYRLYQYLQKKDRLTDNQGLEMVKDQYTLLSQSMEKQVKADSNWIQNIPPYEETKQQKKELLESYITNTQEQLLVTNDMPQLFDTEILINQRNADWLPLLAKALAAQESTFVAVGAGHLYGESGIIKELEALGYKLEK